MGERGPQKQGREMGCMGVEGPSTSRNRSSGIDSTRVRRKRAEDRRREILQVAARLFRAKGYAATSLEEVADAIGITKAAIYYHFTSKDEVLFEMRDRIVRESLVRVRRIVESDETPVVKME